MNTLSVEKINFKLRFSIEIMMKNIIINPFKILKIKIKIKREKFKKLKRISMNIDSLIIINKITKKIFFLLININ